MNSRQPNTRLEKFFAGIAENTFQSQLGIADPPLVDYLTTLLIRFVKPDTHHRVRSVTGKPLVDVGEMVVEATKRMGDAKHDLHRYIGDFTLFWAGVYPEALRSQRTGDVDQYTDYCVQGKRSYQIAAQLDTSSDEAPSPEVLERLSETFELCAYGLREVRREWESPDQDFPGGILLN